MTTMIASRLLTRAEAAEYIRARGLPATRLTLEKLASVGGGPAFRKFGRAVRYDPSDVDSWIVSKLSGPVHSTSELPR